MADFQTPVSIAEAIEHIRRNEYLLPAFQRDFVWSPSQIETLFDSLMRGYPISSMLFWKVKGETKTDFRFCKFLTDFIQNHQTWGGYISTDHLNDFHAVLDGQQRLTALYIGLCGSYAYRGYMKRSELNEKNFPTRHLYMNILPQKTQVESGEQEYAFLFIDKNVSKEMDLFQDKAGLWFRVGRIMSLHADTTYDLDDFIEEKNIERESRKILKRLDNVIFNGRIINYYEEDDQRPDKAVNIFVRINSGGTALSFSDILMSIAVANCKKIDMRTEIKKLLDSIRAKGFNVPQDFILKAFLYLYHKDVRSLITSFNIDFIETIEYKWVDIRDSILSLFDLLKSFGLTDFTMTSYNASLPILYYLHHKNVYVDFYKKIANREECLLIRKWIFTILLRRAFGASADSVLMQSRRAFTSDIDHCYIESTCDCFPANQINSEIKKISDVGDDFIEGLLYSQKDHRYTFPILAMLYPNLDYRNNNFHQDHLHPAASFDNLKQEDKDKYGWNTYNSILNLQMLDANENESKNAMPLADWVQSRTTNENRMEFLERHLIPNDVDLDLGDFSQFIEKRKVLLIKKLKQLIN
ncbi:MAG: DUF262 domain-containing protein [Bacteroidales bacterium]|nr:DUF262 domain-containing protein [Bacteroidales bacterium]